MLPLVLLNEQQPTSLGFRYSLYSFAMTGSEGSTGVNVYSAQNLAFSSTVYSKLCFSVYFFPFLVQ